MNKKLTKKIILNFCNNFSNSKKDLFYNAVEIIGNKYSAVHENNFFECSSHFLRDKVSILNLNFYDKNTPRSVVLRLKQLRFKNIKNIINIFNKNLKSRFNEKFSEVFFSLSEDTLWPLQFGFDLDEKGGRIKLYLSLAGNKRNLVLKNIILLSKKLRLDSSKIISAFYAENFDALGIDLNNDGKCSLKLYTLFNASCDWKKILQNNSLFLMHNHETIDSYIAWINGFKLKHIGFLYRISAKSEIDSVKIWARLNKPYALKSEMCCPKRYAVKVREWFNQVSTLLDVFGVKASYLVSEHNKPGIYFR